MGGEEVLVGEDLGGRGVRGHPAVGQDDRAGAELQAYGRSWVTMSTVSDSDRRISASSRRDAGSRLLDGSSSTRISGRIASTVATATRRRWPNDRWCGGRSACSAIPTASSASRTRASRSAPVSPRFAGPNATSSATVGRNSWSSGSWKTIPTRRRISARFGFSTGSPPTVTDPATPVRIPLRCSTSVVLPAPFGPSSATRSPVCTVRSTPCRTGVPSG